VNSLFGDAAPLEQSDRGAQDRVLVERYVAAGRTLDDLPYTPEFDALYAALGGEGSGRTRGEVFHRLHNLRKAKKLPALGRAATTPVRVTPEEEDLLRALVVERVGTLGQRDQLIFSPAFDDLVQVFMARTGRSLSAHDAWRLIAKLAK
jgi:hypothetical protein